MPGREQGLRSGVLISAHLSTPLPSAVRRSSCSLALVSRAQVCCGVSKEIWVSAADCSERGTGCLAALAAAPHPPWQGLVCSPAVCPREAWGLTELGCKVPPALPMLGMAGKVSAPLNLGGV